MQDSACSPQNCSPQPERHTTCMCGHSFLLATFIFYADKFLMLQHSACANYLDSYLICPYACCVFTYGLNKFGLIFFVCFLVLVFGFCCCFLLFFLLSPPQTRVALEVLELTLQTMLDLNSEIHLPLLCQVLKLNLCATLTLL